MSRRAIAVALALATGAFGCRAVAPVASDPAPPLPAGAGLVAPAELAVSVLRGATRGLAHATVTVRGDRPLVLGEPVLSGEGRRFFQLLPGLSWPVRLRAGEELPLTLGVRAAVFERPGVHRARLIVAPAGAVELVALVIDNAAPEREPPLADIFAALGFTTDVGSGAYALGVSAAPVGAEVPARFFRRAGRGPVTVTALACYTAPRPRAFSYATGQPPVAHRLGTTDAGQNQSLRPTFDEGAQSTTFDPGDAPFALWVERDGHRYHSVDQLNTPPAHAARIYPARTAAGSTPDAWLVALEEGTDGDYQDLVLLVAGARPAPER